MKKLFICLFLLTISHACFSSEITINTITLFNKNNPLSKQYIFSEPNPTNPRSFISQYNNKNIDQVNEDKEIINRNPFKDIDLSWYKEKNRMEKIFISTGAVCFSIGFGIMLAGLLNYLVTFNAQTELSQNTSIALIGVGAGLNVVGIPFILVGSIKLGMSKKKAKSIEEEIENP